jgi:heterodisulfide reductase subunit A-like polyferredoxin
MLKTNAPFGETNVKGVFAAGDAGTVMKQVAMAMQQGGAVRAAIAIQLGQEEDQEVAARLWPEKSRKPEAAVRAPQQNGVDVDDRDRSDGGRWD